GVPRALIIGIAGQDGSYLAERLLADGYEVHGVVRGPLDRELPNLVLVRDRIELLAGDLLDPGSLDAAVAAARPDELYHLASPTFVPDTVADPEGTRAAIVDGTAALLAAAATHVPDA